MRCLNRSSVESYVSTDDGLDNNEISDPTGGGGMCAIETTPSPSARQPIVAKLRVRSADQILKTAAGPTWTRGSGAAELPTTHENVSRNGARGDGMRCLLTGGPVRSCPRSSPTKRASQYSNRSIATPSPLPRSEEHTSELQSLAYLVCRLLLEKKKKINKCININSKKKHKIRI